MLTGFMYKTRNVLTGFIGLVLLVYFLTIILRYINIRTINHQYTNNACIQSLTKLEKHASIKSVYQNIDEFIVGVVPITDITLKSIEYHPDIKTLPIAIIYERNFFGMFISQEKNICV